jgi:hypothetical protein
MSKASASPLQVYLDDRDRDQLEAWSRRRGWSKSDAIRAAIRALVRADDANIDSLLGASGMIRGLPPDVSASFDHYLAETYVAKKTIETGPPKAKRAKRSARPRLRR